MMRKPGRSEAVVAKAAASELMFVRKFVAGVEGIVESFCTPSLLARSLRNEFMSLSGNGGQIRHER